jgi:hypothetical protein
MTPREQVLLQAYVVFAALAVGLGLVLWGRR